MGIKTEYNPDLALRNISEFRNGNRKEEECIPEDLESGKVYDFLKSDHRIYWLGGELPLRETKGNEQLSKPFASIIITEVTHFVLNGKPYTRGRYKVIKTFGGIAGPAEIVQGFFFGERNIFFGPEIGAIVPQSIFQAVTGGIEKDSSIAGQIRKVKKIGPRQSFVPGFPVNKKNVGFSQLMSPLRRKVDQPPFSLVNLPNLILRHFGQ